MITIPGGTFTKGCTSEQIYYEYAEIPIHQVTLSKYQIAEHEIKQFQWRRVIGTNSLWITGENSPVDQVSWYDMINFCNALSEQEGLAPVFILKGTNVDVNWAANGYRLPTEAEWEYAAKGGNKSMGYKYSGNYDIEGVAWYSRNSLDKTHEVGTKQPNELGIYDMSGNVWEWCWDWYGDYSSSTQTDPRGPSTGSLRVFRGGSWDSFAGYCRVALCYHIYPGYRYYDLVFRLARTKN